MEADQADFIEEWYSDDIEDKEDCYEFELKGSVCNVKFDYTDLSAIINGYPGNQIELRQFDNTFTQQKIWKWWYKVGFISMNRNEF